MCTAGLTQKKVKMKRKVHISDNEGTCYSNNLAMSKKIYQALKRQYFFRMYCIKIKSLLPGVSILPINYHFSDTVHAPVQCCFT